MNKRNWLILLLIGAFAITTFNSCKKEETTETDSGPTEWEKSSDFSGKPRNGAATFTINDVAYVVGGQLKNFDLLSDSYSFDGTSWSQKAEFTGDKRHGAVGFSVAGKGYVGLGYDGEELFKDFYQYDPAANTWKKVADFPETASGRIGAVAFTIGNAAYVGLGRDDLDESFNDLYKYDPATDKWSKVEKSFPSKTNYAFAFVINNVAYVGGGIKGATLVTDFYSFDGKDWVQKKALDADNKDVKRYAAGAFAVGSNGYVVSGRSSAGIVTTVWKYNPSENAWSNNSQAIGSPREKAAAFAIKGKGYITTGSTGSTFLDDTYVFTPVR
ncbi:MULTISPECIES: Kelch repeat-containing protein [Sphingobacterium]|uniref:Galactose oxidase n=1 Tax=Sphingobacterium cellulitidis TaxID=1768011 RepID=A0A8H9FZX9_9SPHI|nr:MULTISPECIES: kelch repeat-containing protein [Sphingobacterium]MBA8985383.1 N-acetylneuraminic acid mutarotase [Sphingobacterium soli]WFB63805.1 kelch repeat-containing protein [Sphingobacterium sp. WM]GGE10084.1 hypothetical protein GCM10011516_04760 [Sphingobacterium soli]